MTFQNFTAPTRPEQGPPRLAALRAEMEIEELAAFLVPRADAHQGEYVAPHDDRLAWLTGFTGSAGFAIVLPHIVGVFIDGRYKLQVRAQVDLSSFTPVNWPPTKPAEWLRSHLPGGVVGFDPWLHTPEEIEKLEQGLLGSGISLRRVENLVDRIWHDQPPPSAGPVQVHPVDLAGETSDSKRARLAEMLRQEGQNAAVITLPDSLCWLLNIRGTDIAHNPVVHGFAILHEDARLTLFLDAAKLDDAARAHLGDVEVVPPASLPAALALLSGPVRLDKATAPVWIADQIEAKIAWAPDPCLLPKARKNEAELAGTRAAHLRDGAAMVEFLAWLDRAPDGLTEIDVVRKLESFRSASNLLRDISFETIAGSGPNGAIVHYRVTEETNRTLQQGELLLIDSGGQYADGTTDITRTVALGRPGPEEMAAFTRVLRGTIAVSRVRFPKGLAGRDIDALARYPLWLAGQDYDHGTGHGVGAFLSVHEGPQRISRTSDVALEPGMILSNEPGYYREGAFGIRIENLIVVQEAPEHIGADARPMLSFETLTLCPIDRRLILRDALPPEEREWLDTYHARVRDTLGPLVTAEARAWLVNATEPI